MLTIGSLFSGFGALDLAAEEVFGATTAWVSDIDPGACKVLAHRFPHAPNLGDITAINWADVTPVDIIAGGSPCQDLSTAGRRAGMTDGTRSNLWVQMREAIATIRPRFVIWENVRGAYSAAAASAMESDPGLLGDHPAGQPALRALGRVLGDLAELGYDAQWRGLRAADVGACHGRFRVFVLAERRDAAAAAEGNRRHEGWAESAGQQGRPDAAERGRIPGGLTLLPTPRSSDSNGAGAHGTGGPDLRTAVQLLPTPRVENNENRQSERYGGKDGNFHGLLTGQTSWGQYAPAIARQEQAFGYPAPSPTEPGKNGRPRLSAEFASWMMGAPPGWITDTPGVTRNEALRMAGNGVVRQQAIAALLDMRAAIRQEQAA